jgi:signal-transduction protein with cAMP-binding, CBS, and nucleotidyltransferase domain
VPIPDRYIHPVETVDFDTSAREAARRLKERGVGALVVVEGDGAPAAIVTDRDIALGVLRENLDPTTTPVIELAQRPLRVLNRDESLMQAVRTMSKFTIRRLPIVEDGRLVGIVTADDLIGFFGDQIRWIAETTRTGFEHEAHPTGGCTPILGRE